ncbi:protein NPAT isoform X2 [Denticeps clupeoides]|uniref:protein NPAT isoform X2 n=1 Tax=Denticeps clupeoides TaxID=299321 RepID=UPI0010A2F999|nr:protein NPAT isoform X2 [Denticeps clupeoides]
MLLPSDIARLVLGYLQQEGLTSTTQAFVLESPNLKEYAEHTTEDGTIPSCVFSLFGKNLMTILNEYVAVKAKEMSQENQIPVIMTSLWKKLDFTLNQIKSLQNSPSVVQNQRCRTRNGIVNMRRQSRAQSGPQSPMPAGLSVSAPSNCVATSLPVPQALLSHSTPVCYTFQPARPSPLGIGQSVVHGESPLQIIVPDPRFNPGPLSPARRKCDSPRRRGGGVTGAVRTSAVTSSLAAEAESEDAGSESFPQMVIESAREKILNDRSLQEKLAENINKILSSDSCPHSSKAACNTVEQDQSIDEILGLQVDSIQGEIHMSDNAIQDILEQTESDPAFHALFELFDYGKSKLSEAMDEGEGSLSGSAPESRELGPVSDPSGLGDLGPVHEDPTPVEARNEQKSKVRNVQEVKNKRKVAHPPGSSRTTVPESPASTSMKKVTGRTQKACTSLIGEKKNKEKDLSSPTVLEEEMIVDADVVDIFQEDSLSRKESEAESNNVGHALPASSALMVCSVPEKGSREESVETPANQDERRLDFVAVQDQVDCVAGAKNAAEQIVSCTGDFTPVPAATPSTPAADTPVSAAQDTDPGKIVSLKIIISDDQDAAASEAALSQAVSSITGDNVPTIFLSSPAKSPGKGLLSITPEETAQAVSSLQSTEVSLVVEGAASKELAPSVPEKTLLALHGPGEVPQEPGVIQLVPASPAYGATGSYFVVANTVDAADGRSNVVVLPSAANQRPVPTIVATAPQPQAVVPTDVAQPYTHGSTFIISSPVQPMLQNVVLPVSVAGKFTVVPNQVLTLPCPAPVQKTAVVKTKPKLAPKEAAVPGIKEPSSQVQKKFVPLSSHSVELLGGGKISSPQGHIRTLCFDTPRSDGTVSPTRARNASSSSPPGQPANNTGARAAHTKPIILGGNRVKRRVETVRLDDRLQPPAPPASRAQADASQPQVETSAASPQSENGEESAVQTCVVPAEASAPSESAGNPSGSGGDAVGSGDKNPVQRGRSRSALTRKESKEQSRPEPGEEGSAERAAAAAVAAAPRELAHVTANKENELSHSPTPQNSAPKATSLSKTSPLTKQAAEMLQDMQVHNPASTPPKREGPSCLDLPLPRTPRPGRVQDETPDCMRTPARKKAGRDGESTPRHLVPPATPDLPSCSPASEAGSENSINMAAHTLMILSRAARTGGPLKDSLRQEEASVAAPTGKTKKRKQTDTSPQAKKELHLSGSGKKKSKKKLLDSFPDDLDVDKFLSSLHYDE